ncbi:hypothetical protein [Arthrobacter woluwensis]|uniref:hypothetical protein n=1 Tax=Arthrobacter woluwensis TaxID=156980 RepID=UPI001643BCA2|nr:hypothetical protein [Arthrobacter woluwensis]
MTDLKDLSDSALEDLRAAAVAEQERRYRLASAPAQVAALREQFAADGGDPTEL